MVKRFLIVFLCLLFPLFAHAGTFENIGFLPGNIWFSSVKPLAGDKIQIYTAIFNGDSADLTGTANFFDGNQQITSIPFTLKKDIHVQEVSTVWDVTEGPHQISVILDTPSGTILYKTASTSLFFADKDTDGDRIGDNDDTDDDNDGLLDTDEVLNGTNPKLPDTDKDGMNDGQEVSQGTDPKKADGIASRLEHASTTSDKISAIVEPASTSINSALDSAHTYLSSVADTLRTQIAIAESAKNNANEASSTTENSSASLISGSESPTKMASPFELIAKKGLLAAVTASDFIVSHKIIFYILLGTLTIWLIRKVI